MRKHGLFLTVFCKTQFLINKISNEKKAPLLLPEELALYSVLLSIHINRKFYMIKYCVTFAVLFSPRKDKRIQHVYHDSIKKHRCTVGLDMSLNLLLKSKSGFYPLVNALYFVALFINSAKCSFVRDFSLRTSVKSDINRDLHLVWYISPLHMVKYFQNYISSDRKCYISLLLSEMCRTIKVCYGSKVYPTLQQDPSTSSFL